MKKGTLEELKQDVFDYTKDWSKRTGKILGKRTVKSGVIFSNPNRKNFSITPTQTQKGITVEFIYRNALRFTDAGLGRGYHKGKRVGGGTKVGKGRKRKNFLNRVIRRRIYQLSEVVQGKTVENILISSAFLKK